MAARLVDGWCRVVAGSCRGTSVGLVLLIFGQGEARLLLAKQCPAWKTAHLTRLAPIALVGLPCEGIHNVPINRLLTVSLIEVVLILRVTMVDVWKPAR